MARPLRLEVADGVYHLTSRGNERRAIYRDDGDRRSFLEVLRATLERFGWRCLSYCLMTNHYHLLVRTPDPNLARGMRDLNGVYAQSFNRRYGRVGHLFQGRYRAILVESDEHLLAAVAYTVRNPVRAAMCAMPGEWPWSSHRAALGACPPGLLALDELLDYFGHERASARKVYRETCERPDGDSGLDVEGVVAGRPDFVVRHLSGIAPSCEIPAAHVRPPRHPLPEILAHPPSTDAIVTAYDHGYTMPQIASHLGVHPSTISRRLARHRAQIKT